MTFEPVTPLTVPNYGEGGLPDLARSVLAALGVNGAANPLALPLSRRVCLLVVDGLGWELLREHPAAAPSCLSWPSVGRALTGLPGHHRHQPELAGHRTATR